MQLNENHQHYAHLMINLITVYNSNEDMYMINLNAVRNIPTIDLCGSKYDECWVRSCMHGM